MSAFRERREELLADAAIWGMDDSHGTELAGASDHEQMEWELAAGAATVALLGDRHDTPPPHLLRKLEADALHFYAREGLVSLRDFAMAGLERSNGRRVKVDTPLHATVTPRESAPTRWLTMALAAAVLLVAFALVWQGNGTGPAPEFRREALLRSDDAVRMDWQAGPSQLGGSPRGDIVWSDSRQEGYMRLQGLRHHDPDVHQYQLWIVDEKREGDPVDGGVFDVPADQDEVVIPVDAKLPVRHAKVFVITLEPPGGVVVSKKEEIVAIASS